jgi:hypothetical protein
MVQLCIMFEEIQSRRSVVARSAVSSQSSTPGQLTQAMRTLFHVMVPADGVVCGPLPVQARWNVGVYWRISARLCEPRMTGLPRWLIEVIYRDCIYHVLVWRRCSLKSVSLSVGVDGCKSQS